MKQKEKIIKIIDDNLLETGKTYLLLGQANKLLAMSDAFTIDQLNDKLLKNLLEAGEIPHAYQTKNIPKQWRIPLSDNGKSRQKTFKHKLLKNKEKIYSSYESETRFEQKKSNHIILNHNHSNLNSDQFICPGCGIVLFTPAELKNEKYLQCSSCRKEFKNPLFTINSNASFESIVKKVFAVLFLIFVLYMCIGSQVSDEELDRQYIEGQKNIYKHEKAKDASDKYYENLRRKARREVDNEK